MSSFFGWHRIFGRVRFNIIFIRKCGRRADIASLHNLVSATRSIRTEHCKKQSAFLVFLILADEKAITVEIRAALVFVLRHNFLVTSESTSIATVVAVMCALLILFPAPFWNRDQIAMGIIFAVTLCFVVIISSHQGMAVDGKLDLPARAVKAVKGFSILWTTIRHWSDVGFGCVGHKAFWNYAVFTRDLIVNQVLLDWMSRQASLSVSSTFGNCDSARVKNSSIEET